MFDTAYVYVMASSFQHLYIGVTTKLRSRIHDHKHGTNPTSFTNRYKIDKLVYLESFNYIDNAIAREKQLPLSLSLSNLTKTNPNPCHPDPSEAKGPPHCASTLANP